MTNKQIVLDLKANWVLLKNGRLGIRMKTPKAVHVRETSTEVTGDFQHYKHVFELVDEAGRVSMNVRHLDTYCGYDRGPKREALILGMLRGTR